MMRYAEAVGLVTQGLYDSQTRRFLVEIERKRITREVYFLKSFRDTDKRHIAPYTHFVKGLHSRTQLTLSAIDNHHLRQRLPLGHHACVTTVKHFLHRCEIIGSDHRLYIEMPIIPFSRTTVPKYYATRHRIRALNVRVIETFYMARFRS